MAKFVYVYIGGQMAETPEAQEQAMQAWGAWFGTLGDSVADVGNPFGNSATLIDALSMRSFGVVVIYCVGLTAKDDGGRPNAARCCMLWTGRGIPISGMAVMKSHGQSGGGEVEDMVRINWMI